MESKEDIKSSPTMLVAEDGTKETHSQEKAWQTKDTTKIWIRELSFMLEVWLFTAPKPLMAL